MKAKDLLYNFLRTLTQEIIQATIFSSAAAVDFGTISPLPRETRKPL
jgi:hypothetical protein